MIWTGGASGVKLHYPRYSCLTVSGSSTTALCFYKGCRMLCASSENLMIHTEHHKYETKFRCEHCRMNFLGKVSLRIHQVSESTSFLMIKY